MSSGWYNESKRHSLASRGIRTKNLKNMTNTEYKRLYPKEHWKLDSDRDGVINELDCYPFDQKRQGHLNKQTLARIEKLPIYITDEEFVIIDGSVVPPNYYHILSEDAKQFAPEAREQMLSVLHKYPTVLGDIERNPPSGFIYSSKSNDNINLSGAYDPDTDTVYAQNLSKATWSGYENIPKEYFDPEITMELLHHEMRHKQQADYFGRKGFKSLLDSEGLDGEEMEGWEPVSERGKERKFNVTKELGDVPSEWDADDYVREVKMQYGHPGLESYGIRRDVFGEDIYGFDIKQFAKDVNRYTPSEEDVKIVKEAESRKIPYNNLASMYHSIDMDERIEPKRKEEMLKEIENEMEKADSEMYKFPLVILKKDIEPMYVPPSPELKEHVERKFKDVKPLRVYKKYGYHK